MNIYFMESTILILSSELNIFYDWTCNIVCGIILNQTAYPTLKTHNKNGFHLSLYVDDDDDGCPNCTVIMTQTMDTIYPCHVIIDMNMKANLPSPLRS